MNSFSQWILSILGVVIVCFIAELFLSESKTGKFVRAICATVTVLIIITPIPMLLSGKISFDNDFEIKDSFEIDGKYIDFINNKKLDIMSKNLQVVLENEGIKNAEINILGEWDNGSEIILRQVEINLSKCVIDEKLQHINKYDLAKEKVTKYLKIETEKVVVYG